MYTLKYYLTCDFSKDDAIDRVYLNIYDIDDEIAWAGIFTPTEGCLTDGHGGISDGHGGLGGHLSEEYEFTAPGAVSRVIAILRAGDKERDVFGPLIDVCNYGEWTTIDCSAYDDDEDTSVTTEDNAASCSHDCRCDAHHPHEKRQEEMVTVDDIYEMLG